MRHILGGTKVRGGFYWDRTRHDLQVVPAEGGVLEGGAERRYVRVPALALLLLGPVAGGLYVVAMPVIGVALLAKNLVRKLSAAGAAESAAKPPRPGVRRG